MNDRYIPVQTLTFAALWITAPEESADRTVRRGRLRGEGGGGQDGSVHTPSRAAKVRTRPKQNPGPVPW